MEREQETNVARLDSLSRVFQARPRQPLLNGQANLTGYVV
jgi:hypothetical protein